MSLPENRLSSQLHESYWLYPHPTPFNPLVDYEMGGIAIGNSSKGLDAALWKLFYNDNQIKLGKVGYAAESLFIVPDLKKLALAFDQNMHPCYAWENGVENYVNLIFYDTTINANTTLTFNNISSPCLTLDDHRLSFSGTSDIIFAYIKNNRLCYRQQRERFGVERILSESNVDGKQLTRVAMNRTNCLQFEMQME